MNKPTAERRAHILSMMVEGVSIRSIARLTGASKNTIVKLLRDAGEACLDYQDAALRNLPCTRIQCDELWSFVHAKEKNVPEARKGEFGVGEVWTWTALCADTKLVPCWHVGNRDAEAAGEFMEDLAARLRHRVHLTTDGHSAYLSAVAGNCPAPVGRSSDVRTQLFLKVMREFGEPRFLFPRLRSDLAKLEDVRPWNL